jgi:hypothetical protein
MLYVVASIMSACAALTISKDFDNGSGKVHLLLPLAGQCSAAQAPITFTENCLSSIYFLPLKKYYLLFYFILLVTIY